MLSAVPKAVSRGVLPIVAGLFIVEALDKSGVIRHLAALLSGRRRQVGDDGHLADLGLGAAVNLMNNLPAGLISGSAVKMTGALDSVRSAVLIGVILARTSPSRGRWQRFSGSPRFVVKAITSARCPFSRSA